MEIEQELRNILAKEKQQWGGGDFYQSCEDLGIKGQRPTTERFNTYGLPNLLKKTDKVLDIGCNCGFLALHTAKFVEHVDGVEPVDSLNELGERARQHLGITNCNLIHSSFRKFVPDKKYNAIYLFAVFDWTGMPTPEGLGEKMYEWLEEEGIVVVESHRLDGMGDNFEEKVEAFCKAGFKKESDGNLFDQGHERKFYILRKF